MVAQPTVEPTPTPTAPPSLGDRRTPEPDAAAKLAAPKRVSVRALSKGMKISLSGLAARSAATVKVNAGSTTVATLKGTADRNRKLTLTLKLSKARARKAHGKLKLTASTVTAAGSAEPSTSPEDHLRHGGSAASALAR